MGNRFKCVVEGSSNSGSKKEKEKGASFSLGAGVSEHPRRVSKKTIAEKESRKGGGRHEVKP